MHGRVIVGAILVAGGAWGTFSGFAATPLLPDESRALSGAALAGDSQEAARSLDDLAWIAGHWAGDVEALGGRVDETWLGPAGGSMVGAFRLVAGGRARVYELLLIEQDADGDIYYRFKHVGPGWEPWEEERVEYLLTKLEGQHAFFESTSETPIPRVPMSVGYERTGDRVVVHVNGWDGESFDIPLTLVK